jgi:hypothetical protein
MAWILLLHTSSLIARWHRSLALLPPLQRHRPLRRPRLLRLRPILLLQLCPLSLRQWRCLLLRSQIRQRYPLPLNGLPLWSLLQVCPYSPLNLLPIQFQCPPITESLRAKCQIDKDILYGQWEAALDRIHRLAVLQSFLSCSYYYFFPITIRWYAVSI